MDSYNRGYDASINLPVVLNSTQLGNTTIVASIADDNTDAIEIGFYALAYDADGDGDADIIAYRGTDYPEEDTAVPKDIFHGWSLGAGNIDSEQAQVAVEFYKAIISSGGSNISLTGHSLGGGLAGYVSGLYGLDATVFDAMTFKLAAENTYNEAVDLQNEMEDGKTHKIIIQQIGDPQIQELYVTDGALEFYQNNVDYIIHEEHRIEDLFAATVYQINNSDFLATQIWDPDFMDIDGYHMKDEILDLTLIARDTTGNPAETKTPFYLGEDGEFYDLIDDVPWYYQEIYERIASWATGPIGQGIATLYSIDRMMESIALHSQASLVIRQFADETEIADDYTSWKNAAEFFWPVLYEDAFAGSIDFQDPDAQSLIRGELQTQGKYADILRMAIAYSAIDEGPDNTSARPFGDTAIRALYNDANDLGAALQVTNASPNIAAFGKEISKVFVQYAAELALGQNLQSANSVDETQGVLVYTNQVNNHTLSVDLTDITWTPVHNAVEPSAQDLSSVLVTSLVLPILNETGQSPAIQAAMAEMTGNPNIAAIERVIFNVNNGGITNLSEPASSAEKAVLFVGGAGDDTVNVSEENYLIWGGAGNDTLNGSAQSDTLFGGSGNNIIDGGAGKDFLFGGENNDTINGGAGNDIIRSGLGTDTITLGGGADILRGLTDEVNGDTVTDFEAGDKIELMSLNTSLSTLQQSDITVNTDTIEIDTDGNGTADVTINAAGIGDNYNVILEHYGQADGQSYASLRIDEPGDVFAYGVRQTATNVLEGSYYYQSVYELISMDDGGAINAIGSFYVPFNVDINMISVGENGRIYSLTTLSVSDADKLEESGVNFDTPGYGYTSDYLLELDPDTAQIISAKNLYGVVSQPDATNVVFSLQGNNLAAIYDWEASFGGFYHSAFSYTTLDPLTLVGGSTLSGHNAGFGGWSAIEIAPDGNIYAVKSNGGGIYKLEPDYAGIFISDVVTGGDIFYDDEGNLFQIAGTDLYQVDLENETKTLVLSFPAVNNIRDWDGVGNVSVNLSPVARNDYFILDHVENISGNVLIDNGSGFDMGANGNALSVTSGTFATTSGGSVIVSSNGDFTYTPAVGFIGVDSFDYTIDDGNDGNDTGTSYITVIQPPAPVESLPAPFVDGVAAAEGLTDPAGLLNGMSEITVAVLVQASEVGTDRGIFDGDANGGGDDNLMLRYDKNGFDGGGTNVIKASITTTGGTMTLESASNAQTTDQQHLVLRWKDGEGLKLFIDGIETTPTAISGSASGVISGIEDLLIGLGSKRVAGGWAGTIDDFKIFDTALSEADIYELATGQPLPDNFDPVANVDTASTYEDTEVTIDVLANDSDFDEDTLSVSTVTQGANGSVAINPDKTVTYTPNAGFIGTDSFTYTVDDGEGGSDIANVNVTVNAAITGGPAPIVNGVTEAENLPDPASLLNGLDEITVMARIQASANDVGSDRGIFDGDADSGGDDVLMMRYDVQGFDGGGTNVIKLGLTTTGGIISLESAANVQTTDPQHLTMTWKSGEGLKLYIDGIETIPTSASGTASGVITGVEDLLIGLGSKRSAGLWEGSIDDFRIYDTALEASDIYAIATNAPIPIVDGVTEAENLADPATLLNGLDEITIAVQVQASEIGTDRGIFDGDADSGGDDVLMMRYDVQGFDGGGTNVIKVGLTTTSGTISLESASNVQTTAPQHLTMTWKSGEGLKLYIDGIETIPTSASGIASGVITGVEDLLIGLGSKRVAGGWAGTIDDFKIFDTALDAGDVYALATGGTGPGNIDPIAADDLLIGNEDEQITGNVLSDNGGGSDIDPNGDPLNVIAQSGLATAQGGSVTIASNGNFTYTPAAGFFGTDSFTYTLEDGQGGSDTGTVTLTVFEDTPTPAGIPAPIVNGVPEATYLADPASLLNGLDEITISVKVQANEIGTDRGIFDGDAQRGGDDNIMMRYDAQGFDGGGTNVIKTSVTTTGGTMTLESASNVQTTDPQHLIMTWKNGEGLKLYIDGVQTIPTAVSGTASGTISGVEDLLLGLGPKNDGGWNGSINDFEIYDVALDATQVSTLVAGGPPAMNPVDGTTSSESLFGTAEDDLFDGQEGDDYLYGYGGDDDYIWSTGDGNDYITEDTGGGLDEILFGPGILDTDLRFEKDSSNLKIYIGSEFLTVYNQFSYDDFGSGLEYQVEQAVLDNVTVIDIVNDLTFTGTANGEYVYGTSDNNTLKGLGGDDYLYAGAGNDTLIGGAGQDYLYGQDGDDDYVWGIGEGNDYINEEIGGGLDQILFGPGILDTDLRFEKDGSNLKIHVGSEVVSIYGQFSYDDFGSGIEYQVEQAVLNGGAILDILNNLTFTGTTNGEFIYGTSGHNTLKGLAGSDYLYAGAGDDVLFGGAGEDYMYGEDGADTFAFESATAYGAQDYIYDFSAVDGDKLDLSDLLGAYDPLTELITDFVQIMDDGFNSTVHVDADGGADNFVQIATLQGATGLTDEAALEAGGTLITA